MSKEKVIEMEKKRKPKAEKMQGVKTCALCQGMHASSGELCATCEKMPAGTVAVVNGYVVEVNDDQGHQFVIQGIGAALVVDAATGFKFKDGAQCRVVVQQEIQGGEK